MLESGCLVCFEMNDMFRLYGCLLGGSGVVLLICVLLQIYEIMYWFVFGLDVGEEVVGVWVMVFMYSVEMKMFRKV